MGEVLISHGGRSHRLRCDPDSIFWSYNLNTKVDETYGGKVVQLLSVNLGTLTINASSGSGRWNYLFELTKFCRDILFLQKDTGQPATLIYPSKGWEMDVYLMNIPFSDEVGNTDFPYTLRFRIQEDVSGVISSASMTSELDKIQDGIGHVRNDYNYPMGEIGDDDDVAGDLSNPINGGPGVRSRLDNSNDGPSNAPPGSM